MRKTCIWLCCLLSSLFAPAQKNIIFETDMGNDIDDALALDMLYKWDDMKKINLMAVMLNKMGEYPPQYIDVMNTWYGHKKLPIGTIGADNANIAAKPNYTKTVVTQTGEDGKPLYKRTVKDISKLTAAPELYRKLLAKAKDKSVTIVSVGFSTNLALLLSTQGDKYSPLSGRKLVEKKVDRLIVMAANMANPDAEEFNVKGDVPACQKVYTEWPTPIYTTAWELGVKVCYPGQSIRDDFGWASHHPMVDSYRDYRKGLEDSPMWDVTAVLYAVDPQDMFDLSPRGRITISETGKSRFTPEASGNHYYLITSQEQEKKILDYFLDFIPQKPAKAKLK